MEINIKKICDFKDLNIEDVPPFGFFAISDYIQYLSDKGFVQKDLEYNEYKNVILKDKVMLTISPDNVFDVLRVLDVIRSVILNSKADIVMINNYHYDNEDFQKWIDFFIGETCYIKLDSYEYRTVLIREV